ncbi:hypothetical protein [Bartonella taylorii]|uniref:hypothetical protein n=1 Tax=Bartonella taylorii TaxID=33046 RepID=UPI001FEDB0CB|nr:hypothetical protein [Bartonella taylorii]
MFLLKKYKMLSRSFSILFCTFLTMMALEFPVCAKPLRELVQWERWDGVGYLIFLLPVFIWVSLFTSLSILWAFSSAQERKLKKTKQKLEKTPEA